MMCNKKISNRSRNNNIKKERREKNNKEQNLSGMLPLCQKINDFENLITTIVDLFSVQRFSFFLVVTLSNDQQNRTKINKRDREKKVAFFFLL